MLSARTNNSSVAKVSFQGDTKRVSLNGDYEELVARTRASFSNLPQESLKFFYLDEDHDLISLSSQADLSEALEMTSQLKLTVADSAKNAHEQLASAASDWEVITQEEPKQAQLEKELEVIQTFDMNESEEAQQLVPLSEAERELIGDALAKAHDQSMAEALYLGSLNESLAPACGPSEGHVFDTLMDSQVARQLQAQMYAQEEKKQRAKDEAALEEVSDQPAGEKLDAESQEIVDLVTESFNFRFNSIFDPELRAELEELEKREAPDQNMSLVVDCFAEMLSFKPHSGAKSSGAAQQADPESESDEEISEEHLDLVSKTVARLFEEKIKEVYTPMKEAFMAEQAQTKHEGVVCNSCMAHPIVGIRYMCTVCGDMDLCEACEAAGAHPDHVLCKIRKPSQAPVKLVCQYSGSGRDAEMEMALAMSLGMEATSAGQQEE